MIITGMSCHAKAFDPPPLHHKPMIDRPGVSRQIEMNCASKFNLFLESVLNTGIMRVCQVKVVVETGAFSCSSLIYSYNMFKHAFLLYVLLYVWLMLKKTIIHIAEPFV